MMQQQYFPCIPASFFAVPSLIPCETKRISHKSESTPEDDDADADAGGGGRPTKQRRTCVVSVDAEDVKKKKKEEFKDGCKVDVISLLSGHSSRDYLVNSSGEQVKVSSIKGKYILIHCFKLPVDCSLEQGLICWALKRAIPHWPNFQLVVVTKLELPHHNYNHPSYSYLEKEAFSSFIAAFPNCLAIPISDSDSYDRVSHCLDSEALLLDPNGIVVQDSGASMLMMNFGVPSFPFTYDHYDKLGDVVCNWLTQRPVSLEDLLGLGLSHILYNAAADTISVSDLKHKLVGLYLYNSGHLIDAVNRAYQFCQANNLELHIVLVYLPISDDAPHFISCTHAALRDKGISSWWLLPFDDSTSRRLWQLCESSRRDELIIVGPGGQFLDSFAANILTYHDSDDAHLKLLYPYAAEALARQETQRLKKLTLSSLFSSPQQKTKSKLRLLTQQGRRIPLKKLRGKVVCLFVAHDGCKETRELLTSWCDENEGRKVSDDVALVFVPSLSSNFDLTPNSDRKLSWLWNSTLPWLICPPDPALEASMTKQTALKGISSSDCGLSYFTFRKDGTFLSVARPDLSEIKALCFPRIPLYDLVLEDYTETYQYERSLWDCY